MNRDRRSLVLIAATLATGGVLRLPAQTPTFRARVEAVRVEVLVTDGHRVVPDLGPSDFQVLDNGVLQTVDLVSLEQLPLNVVLAFDVSDSVTGGRLEHLKRAGLAVAGALRKPDRVGLVTFSRRVSQRAMPTADAGRIRAALDAVTPAGETALVDGCFAGLVLAETGPGRSLLIAFSDGVDTASWLTAEEVLAAARRSETVVYAISAGRSRRVPFLARLSESTGGTLFEVESTTDLEALFLRILDEFRQRYLLSYTPRGVARDGWHRLEVRVQERRVTVKARPGYQAGR